MKKVKKTYVMKPFTVPIFDMVIEVYLGPDFKAINDHFPDIRITPDLYEAEALCISYHDEKNLITDRTGTLSVVFKPTVLDGWIISHEGTHACNYIMTAIGYKVDQKNDEVFCYLNGYIYKKIEETLRILKKQYDKKFKTKE